MKPRWIAALATLLFSAPFASAQFTSITATVKDPSGSPYVGCHAEADFVPSPTATTQPLINGSVFPTSVVLAQCDSFGNAAWSLVDNNQVSDGHSGAASQWRFSITSQDGKTGFSCVLTVTGTTQNISAALQACAAPLPPTGGGGGNFVVKNLPCASSMTFTMAGVSPNTSNTAFFINPLNCNVTTSTVVPPTGGTLQVGAIAQFTFVQPPAGGFSLTWPANFIDQPAIQVGASATTNASFWYDGRSWHAQTFPAAGGAGGNPAGAQGTIQSTTGASFAVSNLSEPPSGPLSGKFKVNEDSGFCGPNPYVDIRCFGARAVNPNVAPAAPGITASCTSGQPTVTLSSASTFQNGDGVIIYGCGPAHSMATPAAPTVTPSIARTMTGTKDVVNGPGASTTYNYCVAWRDLLGGMTACSPTGTTTTGTAALGSISVALTSLSRSNDVVTAVTSSAHGLPVGCGGAISGATACPMVYIQTTDVADNSWLGWFRVTTVADTTHFTYQGGQDTRGTPAAPSTVTGSFTGNVFWYQSNHVSFGAVPTGGLQPYTYAAGGALIGPSWATNPTSPTFFTDTTFEDLGGTMLGTTNIAAPGYVPTIAPASATNDALSTTIVSGAGTTTLTLAANAGNTISGQTILLDSAPAVEAAVAANYNGIAGPPVYFPKDPAGNVYVTNSVLDLRTNSPILVINNSVAFNDTVLLGSGSVSGRMLPGKNSVASFSFGSYASLSCKVNPCLYVTNTQATGYMDWLSVGTASNGINQAVLVMQDGGSAKGPPNYTNMDIGIGGGQTSMSFLGRGTVTAGFAVQGDRLNITGVQNTDGATATPVFLATNAVQSIKFGSIFLNGQGMMDTGGGQIQNDWLYCQGCRTPFWTISNNQASNTGLQAKFGAVTHDTTAQPLLDYIPSLGTVDVDVELFNDSAPSSGAPVFSGNQLRMIQNYSGLGSVQGQNRNFSVVKTGSGIDGLFAINGSPNYTVQQFGLGTSLGQSYPLFTEATPMAAPSVAVAAGGSVAVGSHTYQILPVWFSGGTGPNSLTSAACVTTPGNQTCNLTWTPTTACKGYNIVKDGQLESGTVPQISGCGTSSFSDTLASSFGGSSGLTTGGPSMVMPGTQGIVAPQWTLAGGGFSSVHTGTFTASRSVTWPDGSGTVAFINLAQTWTANQSIANGSAIRFFAPNGTTYTGLTGPASNGTTVTFQLPSSDSTGVQCISSNGSGVLAFSNCSAGTGTPGGSNKNLQYNNSSSFGGASNGNYTSATGVFDFSQLANGNETITGHRFTDTSPTGNILHFQNAALNADLFKLDVSGNVTANTLTLTTPLAYASGGTNTSTSFTNNQLVTANGGALGSLVGTLTGTNPVLTLTSAAIGNVPFALNTPASPTADIFDLSINSVKTSWVDNTGVWHAPSYTATGTGPLILTGTEGTCTSPASGVDILCIGNSTNHTIQSSLNNTTFKDVPQWANSGPAAHGVVVAGVAFPQEGATAPGTTGQAFISSGASADPAFGTLGPVGGGTGNTTLTAHGVIVGEGTSATTSIGPNATANLPLLNQVSADPVYSALPLSGTTVSGQLPIANGGTGQSTLAAANIATVTGAITVGHCTQWSASTVITDSGAACGGSGGAARLDQITAATLSNTINNGVNPQIWNWALTGSTTAFKFGENTAASGSSNILFQSSTLNTSTAAPFQADSNGNGWQLSSAGLFKQVGTGALAVPGTAHGVVVSEGAGSAIATPATGNAGQVLISNGSSADPTFQDPVVSQAFVNIWNAQDITVTRTSANVRNPIFSQTATLQLTFASITGSPGGCTLQFRGVDSQGNVLNNGGTVSISLANGTTSQTFTAASTLQTASQVSAVYACSTYPTAGTLTLDFTPIPNVNVTNTVAVSGTVTTTPPANASTNVAQFGGNAVVTGIGAGGNGIPRVTISNDSSLAANQSVNVAQVAGNTTSTAASGVQKVGIVGNAGAVVDAATGAAPPANAIFIGGLKSGATGGFVTGITACDLDFNINISAATTTLAVTGVSGRQVRICSVHMVNNAADNVAFIEGTGATCGTGTAGMAGGTTAASGYNFPANGGLTLGGGVGEVMTTATTGDSVCIVTSAATQLSGHIKYTIY